MLKAGGSAAEAAVAMAAALAVVYPHMNSIGGDSFWLVREPSGRVFGVDARGRAAGRADPSFYRSRGLDAIPWRGPLAANTVAGTLSGWSSVLNATVGSTKEGADVHPNPVRVLRQHRVRGVVGGCRGGSQAGGPRFTEIVWIVCRTRTEFGGGFDPQGAAQHHFENRRYHRIRTAVH
jgi:hypothetical protein